MFEFLSGEKGSHTLNCFCSFLFPPVNPLNLLVLGKLDVCMSSLQCWRSYMWGVLYLGVFYVPNSTTESHPQPHYFSPQALASVHLGQAALSWISQQEPHSEL